MKKKTMKTLSKCKYCSHAIFLEQQGCVNCGHKIELKPKDKLSKILTIIRKESSQRGFKLRNTEPDYCEKCNSFVPHKEFKNHECKVYIYENNKKVYKDVAL